MSKFISLSGGHGGSDSGATGNGYKEKDLSIELVNLIAKYLIEGYIGFVLNAIQEKNSSGQFKSVSSYGTESGFFASIHFNSNSGNAGTGTEVLQGKFGNARCRVINNVLAKYFTNRGIKEVDTDSYYMLREADFDMIVEICFINNKSDMEIYQKNKNKIAKDLADAIAKYEGLSKKEATVEYKKYASVSSENRNQYYDVRMKIEVGTGMIWEDLNATKSTGVTIGEYFKDFINSRYVGTIIKDGQKWWMHECLNSHGVKRYYCYKREM